MVFFITLLRALAACLITNAHYTGIYPTDLIANGGLIGDIIFFAVSGYCLYNVKGNFAQWYSKRVVRCYLPVWLITFVYMLLGFYSLSKHPAAWWYIYPTYYHFVTSIVLLYIPYYIIMKTEALRKRLLLIMMTVFAICVFVYIVFYDKSYYHIDTVREPMIRFLFLESMLLGAYFKQRGDSIMTGFKCWHLIGSLVSFCAYFVSKLMFSKVLSISNFQIFNWFAVYAVLFFIFRLFAGLEKKMKLLPRWLRTVAEYLAVITLEIYVVQYVIIDLIRPLFPFPINWFVLTASILLAATALHFVCQYILKIADIIFCKMRKTVKQEG